MAKRHLTRREFLAKSSANLAAASVVPDDCTGASWFAYSIEVRDSVPWISHLAQNGMNAPPADSDRSAERSSPPAKSTSAPSSSQVARKAAGLAVLDDCTSASWFAYSIEVPESIPLIAHMPQNARQLTGMPHPRAAR